MNVSPHATKECKLFHPSESHSHLVCAGDLRHCLPRAVPAPPPPHRGPRRPPRAAVPAAPSNRATQVTPAEHFPGCLALIISPNEHMNTICQSDTREENRTERIGKSEHCWAIAFVFTSPPLLLGQAKEQSTSERARHRSRFPSRLLALLVRPSVCRRYLYLSVPVRPVQRRARPQQRSCLCLF